jgi:Ser/Thr protein kinase RdoA (MazF antagonist)
MFVNSYLFDCIISTLIESLIQVLHGDLAARNVLLADDGVAKVADFGMARKMYYEGNYEKTSQV